MQKAGDFSKRGKVLKAGGQGFLLECVIPAAGEGKRMRPLTATRPKVMIPLANRPMADHLVCATRDAGITEFVFMSDTGSRKSVSIQGTHPSIIAAILPLAPVSPNTFRWVWAGVKVLIAERILASSAPTNTFHPS